MKKLSMAAMIAAVALSSGAFAQVQIDGQASVEIISTMSIVETTAMDFGQLVPGTAVDTVSMDSAGTVTTAGGPVGAQEFPGSTPTAALFTITGQPSSTIAVTVVDGAADLSGPGADIVFDSPVASSASVALDAAGSGTFTVGGDITIDPSQTAGTYTSATAYVVTIDYQ